MRGRTGTFFGRRALLALRFSLSVLPVARPKWTFQGKSTGMEGYWESEERDSKVLYNISLCHSSKPASQKPDVKRNLTHKIYAQTCHSSKIDEDGDLDESWSWWEGIKMTTSPDGSRVYENIAEDVVLSYIAYRSWYAQYIDRSWNMEEVPETGLPWLDALHDAAGYAKRFQGYTHGSIVNFAYFLRLREPQGRLRFCADLSRAIKLAKKVGVEVYVMPPPRKR